MTRSNRQTRRDFLTRSSIALGVSLGLGWPANASGADPDFGKRVARVTSGLVQRMAQNRVPGVSIALIEQGAVGWAQGFGAGQRDGAPINPHTLFQAASISKPVTALAVMKLVQTGVLNLDRDVNDDLKSWKIPANRFTSQAPVTLRRLLSHTAGISVHGFDGYAHGDAIPTLQEVLDGTPSANSPPIRVESMPGTRWQYSGGGFVIVQQLLEDKLGRPFATLMNDVVLNPLQMSESTFEQPLDTRRAQTASNAFRNNGQPVSGGPHIYPEQAAAGLWTTPSDLAKVLIALQQSFNGARNAFLSQSTAKEMLTPVMNGWGLGVGVGGDPAHRAFGHEGANEGYRCQFVANVGGEGAVVMTNSDSGDGLANTLIQEAAL